MQYDKMLMNEKNCIIEFPECCLFILLIFVFFSLRLVLTPEQIVGLSAGVIAAIIIAIVVVLAVTAGKHTNFYSVLFSRFFSFFFFSI
jgi:hypothetical protein